MFEAGPRPGKIVSLDEYRSRPRELSVNPLPQKTIDIDGCEIAYVESGEGDPIVFLHGLISSSYTWRNVIPSLAGVGRCIAPDFPGMGFSGVLPDVRTDSRYYRRLGELLDAFLKKLGVEKNVTLVLQDFGNFFGCDWAYRNPGSIKGIVHNCGVYVDSISDAEQRQNGRSQQKESNDFRDFVRSSPTFLSDWSKTVINRELSPQEIEHYGVRIASPGEARLPILRWLSCIPAPGQVLESSAYIAAYTSWMKHAQVPKLWLRPTKSKSNLSFWADVASGFSAQTELPIEGNDMLTEDNPFGVADSILSWLQLIDVNESISALPALRDPAKAVPIDANHQELASGSRNASHDKKSVMVDGLSISYREQGEGDPIVFVHTNWCSSFSWRDVIPNLAQHGRCIALDLPGFGDSDALGIDELGRRFLERQCHYFERFLEELDATQNVILVMHGVGTTVGCAWALRHQADVRGVVHSSGCFADASCLAGDTGLDDFRTKPMQTYLLQTDDVIETLIPPLVNKKLSDTDMQEYSRPFRSGSGTRLSMVNWFINIPSYGQPQYAHSHALQYSAWLRFSNVPKLRIKPSVELLELFNNFQKIADGFEHQAERRIEGGFLLMEDNPDDFAQCIIDWLAKLPPSLGAI